MVTTPISTTVYYDLSKSTSEDIRLNILSVDDQLETFSFAFTSNDIGDVSFTWFNGFKWKDTQYYLVAYNSEGEQLTQIPIPIN